ncbi:MAG: hypothetical protein KAV87_31385 [Desulfobacteraceae bacterium]|nr:hypothetical protein [Desulfobacteraceae bacterium]
MDEKRDPTVEISRGLRRRVRAAGKKRKPTVSIKAMVDEACEVLLKAEKANK